MTRYWLAKISEDIYYNYALKNNVWLMQQQYNNQTNSAVTNIWTAIKEIKSGDYLMLGYKDKIHAIGKVCIPREIPQSHIVSNLAKAIKHNTHEYNEGFITYDDNEVFYENFTVFDGEWGQRIEVENWQFYSENGIRNNGILEGSTGNLATYTLFEIKEVYFKNKLKELKFEYMKALSFSEKIENLLKSNKNIVLTGAPGTGKTFLAKQIAKKIIMPTNIKEEVVSKSIESFLKQDFEVEKIKMVDNSWLYWKSRILSPDFNLDDFANTQANITEPDKILNGYYLMNFLEWKSTIYGSSKPGNAFNYGIKMNNDNRTYTIYDNKEESVVREIAEKVFNEKIKMWLQNFIKATLSEKIAMAETGNELIRAGQLIRKMIILEYPTEYLSTYQDSTIANAYTYFLNGKETSYYAQNKAILEHLENRFHLEKNKANQLRITDYIWTYFNKKANGKSKTIEDEILETYFNEHIEFVQFHPSYDYTDFVEGLRPIKKGGGELGFELKNGVFKRLCKKAALDNSNANYVIIIDEINRAEISKVFGELFYAIDPGYRGQKGIVKTQYSNMQNEETCFLSIDDTNFYVPENVFIIGTMNDIDRSVEAFDFAMRRRFTWIEINASDRIGMFDEAIPEWKEAAVKKMKAINEVISDKIESLNSSYHIGPAYFLKLQDYDGDFIQLWSYHIEPLLREYLRGLPNADKDLKMIKEAFDNE